MSLGLFTTQVSTAIPLPWAKSRYRLSYPPRTFVLMRGACVWSSVRVPMGEVADWSRAEVLAGLAELERVQREVSAAMAGLVIALGIERRDTAAVLARTCGVSSLEARNRAQVAEVVSKLPAAGAALAAGALSAEHVRALGSVASTEGVVALLNGAGERSPEELARQAMALRMEADHGVSLSARQRAGRCIGGRKGQRVAGRIGKRGRRDIEQRTLGGGRGSGRAHDPSFARARPETSRYPTSGSASASSR